MITGSDRRPRAARRTAERAARSAERSAPEAPGTTAAGAIARHVLIGHLLLSPVVLSRLTIEAFEYPKVVLLIVAALVLAAMGVATLFSRSDRAWWRQLRGDSVSCGVLLILAVAVVTTVTSISPRTSILGAHESYAGLVTMVAYAVVFFATRLACGDPAHLRHLLYAAVIAAAAAGAWTVLQISGVDPINWGRTSELGGVVRPFATLGHPNFLGAYLAMTLPLVAYAALRAARAGQRTALGIFIAIGALSVLAIAATASRGAWLAAAVAVLVVGAGWIAAGERRAGAVVLAAVVLGATLAVMATLVGPSGGHALANVVDRARHLFDSVSRQHIWMVSLEIFRSHPIVGSGLDTFQLAFAPVRTVDYWLVEWNATPAKAHNEALHILATQGLTGGVAVLVFTVALVVAFARGVRRGASGDRLLMIAIGAGVAAFYVQNMFSFTVVACGVLFVTFAAALARLAVPDEQPSRARISASPFVLAGALAVPVVLHNVDAAASIVAPALVLIAALGAATFATLVTERDPTPGRAGSTHAPWIAAGAGVVAILLVIVVVRPFVVANSIARDGINRASRDPAGAIERLETAIALDPHTELHRVKLGTSYHAQARRQPNASEHERSLARARDAFKESIRLVPVNGYNHANLGRTLGDLARVGGATPDAAFAAFDEALARDPNNAYFYADAAVVAIGVGAVARARDYAARALARYPDFPQALGIIGHLTLIDGRPAEAERLLRRAVDADWRGVDTWRLVATSNLAAALLRLRRIDDAAETARRALRLAPNDPGAHYNLAKALELQGRRAEAIGEYRTVLSARPPADLEQAAREDLRHLGVAP